MLKNIYMLKNTYSVFILLYFTTSLSDFIITPSSISISSLIQI